GGHELRPFRARLVQKRCQPPGRGGITASGCPASPFRRDMRGLAQPLEKMYSGPNDARKRRRAFTERPFTLTRRVPMYYDEDSGAVTFIAGILLGAVVGASLALLTAPQSGKRTRRRLIEAVSTARDS